MKSGIKTAQVLGGFSVLMGVVFFMAFTLLASLDPSGIVTKSVLVWAGVALFLIFVMEGVVYWIKQSFRIKEENMQDDREKGIVSRSASIFASYGKYKSIVDSIILIALFLAFTGLAIYIFVPLLKKGATFTPQFYTLLAIYAVYFIVLRRFLMKFFSRAGKFARDQLPTCSVEEDGLLINIKFKKGKAGIIVLVGFVAGIIGFFFLKSGSNLVGFICIGIFGLSLLVGIFGGKVAFYPVKILFSEIREIRELSFVEAQSYLDYKIGPDVSLAARSSIELARFLRNPADPSNRPNIYTFMPASSGARTLVIRGENLFYVLAVGNEDVNSLVNEVQKRIRKN